MNTTTVPRRSSSRLKLGLGLGLLGLAGLFAVPQKVEAFCGFFVSGADANLTNNASQVVLLRKGNTTALSMSNNYQGPPEDFAMVVPVPVVLKKEQVKTLAANVFQRIDQLSAPRLVEYWEQDPCYVPPPVKYKRRGMANKKDGAVYEDRDDAGEVHMARPARHDLDPRAEGLVGGGCRLLCRERDRGDVLLRRLGEQPQRRGEIEGRGDDRQRPLRRPVVLRTDGAGAHQDDIGSTTGDAEDPLVRVVRDRPGHSVTAPDRAVERGHEVGPDPRARRGERIRRRQVLVGEASDPLAEFRALDRRDLVDHQPARLSDPGRAVCVDGDPEQRGVGGIGRHRTDRHGRGRVEQVILDDHHRPWLAGVPTASRRRPDLSSLHAPSPRASMKAWSSPSLLLDATLTAWSCACWANWGDRTSGTQSCTGRNPWARSRSRWARTRMALGEDEGSPATARRYM